MARRLNINSLTRREHEEHHVISPHESGLICDSEYATISVNIKYERGKPHNNPADARKLMRAAAFCFIWSVFLFLRFFSEAFCRLLSGGGNAAGGGDVIFADRMFMNIRIVSLRCVRGYLERSLEVELLR